MSEEKCCKCSCKHSPNFGGGGIYGFGVIGSLFYFLPSALGAQEILIALIKSVFWPALLIIHILQLWKL